MIGYEYGMSLPFYIVAVTDNAFLWARQPPKITSSPLGDKDPQITLAISSAFERTLIYRIVSYLAHGSFGPPESDPRTVSRSVQLSLQAHERDQQTDTQTDRPRYCVCSNRLHPAAAVMRPKMATTETDDDRLSDLCVAWCHAMAMRALAVKSTGTRSASLCRPP